MKRKLKTIGKLSEKIGNTTVTGEGAIVDIPDTDTNPDTVAVRDYVAGKGYSGIVSWDGKNPTVAGIKVNPTEIRNGISYATKSDMDSVIKEVENRAGIKDAEKMREDKYGRAERDAFDAVANRKEFSYNPENDAVFQAYKKQYERQAESAMRSILNANNTSVTGASSAVLSEAMAARDAELDKITDIIPELYRDAYARYTGESELDNASLKTISGIANDYYDRVYQSNNDIIKRMNEAGEAERAERQRQIDNERDAQKDMYENALSEIELRYQDDVIRADLEKTRTASEKTAMDNAIARGFFIASDEEKMPWLKAYRQNDGTYSITPSVASVAYEYDSAHARERAKLNAKRGL